MKIVNSFFVVILMATIFLFCKNDLPPQDGEALAKTYCATCHLYPEPNILDQKTWRQYILPRMGAFMGIYQNEEQRDSLIEKGMAEKIIKAANVFPRQAILKKEDWDSIQQFYLSNASKQLSADSSKITLEQSSSFQIVFPDLFLSPPSVTFVSIENDKLIIADANKKVLLELDTTFEIQKQAKVGEGLVHLKETSTDLWATIMGNFSPSEIPNGYIFKLNKTATTTPQKVIQNLQRPVHSSYSDFDQDGLMDVVVCEFGKWTGALSLHSQKLDGTFEKKVLINRPGATKTELIDYNADGLQDILVLFAQGDEGILLLTNKGNNDFEISSLLRFHPSMGSSYFSLFDFNQDGKKDIIYTAGDNADYPAILKPYHGIYIFTQQDNFQFKQTIFLPLPGAYKAIPFDYDMDGDIEIAAISFFPDYRQEQVADFILFERVGDVFRPTTIDLKNAGRWISMDAGDFDQDGDTDIVLGSLTFEVPGKPALVNQWVQNGLPFVLLKNLTRE